MTRPVPEYVRDEPGKPYRYLRQRDLSTLLVVAVACHADSCLVVVSGRTYPVKDALKQLGLRWDPVAGGWSNEHARWPRAQLAEKVLRIFDIARGAGLAAALYPRMPRPDAAALVEELRPDYVVSGSLVFEPGKFLEWVRGPAGGEEA